MRLTARDTQARHIQNAKANIQELRLFLIDLLAHATENGDAHTVDRLLALNVEAQSAFYELDCALFCERGSK